MELQTGLFDKIVVQRTASNRSDAAFSGTCETAGAVIARVTQRGKVVPGFAKKSVGRAQQKKFSGRLKGLPVGGPYDVTLSIGKTGESVTVKSVLVGDVWILAGQSNMQGRGHLQDAAKPSRNVRAFYMHDEWGTAKDPIHHLADSMDAAHDGRADGRRTRPAASENVGPGVEFGKAMARRTGVPQGLIPCAKGGTSMDQWDPALKSKGGGSLYGAMIRRFRKNGSRVAGVLWYQGCSDANMERIGEYTQRTKTLFRAMRKDFGDAQLPIVAVQISRYGAEHFKRVPWNSIQEQQRRLPESVPNCVVVPTIDLEMGDHIHLNAEAHKILGKRLEQAMSVLRGDRSAGKPPIVLKSVAVEADPGLNRSHVTVSFGNITGKLEAAILPMGFMLANADGAVNYIYRVELAGDTAVLRVALSEADLRKLSLYYGYGTNPCCNITDSAGRPVPMFGPITLEKAGAKG